MVHMSFDANLVSGNINTIKENTEVPLAPTNENKCRES